jgi:tetratricopeptide (TPR) repeat protein
MSYQSELLQAGIDAIKQGRYSEAVQSLEAFCRNNINPRSKDYFQAQMWLVKAYQENGESELAIALCRQLAASENPQVQVRAQRILQSLLAPRVRQPQASESSSFPRTQPTQAFSEEQSQIEQPAAQAIPDKQPLTQEQAAELLKTGNKALKQGHYAEAVQALEEFCRETDPSAKDYSQTQMWLAKAYKGNGQLDEAIALSRQLTTSENQVAQIWAQQFLQSLSPAEAPSSQPEPIPQEPEFIPQAGRTAKVSQSRTRSSTAGPDLTRPILSAVCHGSILFTSGLLPILIPIVILIFVKDTVVRENAKEALSFIITLFVWVIVFAILSLIKIGLVLLILLGIFSWVMPIIAIIQCIQKPDEPFRYPFISHLF